MLSNLSMISISIAADADDTAGRQDRLLLSALSGSPMMGEKGEGEKKGDKEQKGYKVQE